TRTLSVSSAHTASDNRRSGADIYSGPNTPRIRWSNPPRASPRSNASWAFSHRYSRGQGSPLTYHPLQSGCREARRLGTRPTHLLHAVRRQEGQANRRRRPGPQYSPGEWVWLSTKDLRLRLPCRKLSPRYEGPFQIKKQITPVSFRLDLPANYRISPTFHVSLLKPADGPRGAREERSTSQPPPAILVDGEEAYRVHELLDSRRRGKTLQYLVDWEGFGPEERSWADAKDILGPTLTEEFHRAHPEKPAPRPRGRPRRRVSLRVRSRSQGGGSVTKDAPAPPPSRHRRDPSPEY
uniref:Chromo domain-containing protein n=1 Tax=Gasterosteus aculeatus aculeatus TaxID=481459 RepID=A0AAQ4S1N1_GASAC